VNRNEAWKTALTPKCEYVFCGADDDNLGDGCRIIVPPGIMGERMQDAIVREQKRNGRDKGNPRLNPYLFEWTHDDRAKVAKDAYRVDVLGKAPTDEVLKIIRDTEPPDTSDLIAWGDADELRALLEAHSVLDARLWIPMLDKAFPARDDSPKGDPAPAREGVKDAPASAGPSNTPAVKSESKQPSPPAKEELYDCEHCGAKEVMKASDFDCPKCGAKYVEVGEGDAKSTVLGYRPCLSCKTPVALPGVVGPGKAGDKVKCGKCGAEHFENGDDPPAWAMVEASRAAMAAFTCSSVTDAESASRDSRIFTSASVCSCRLDSRPLSRSRAWAIRSSRVISAFSLSVSVIGWRRATGLVCRSGLSEAAVTSEDMASTRDGVGRTGGLVVGCANGPRPATA
jgi:DNA-directed RNA polymerase subunit RPC12/RpoP